MDLRDEQPLTHEIGRRTYLVADVEPLDVDGVRTVEVGIVLFLLAFVALLPFYGQLQSSDRTWWLWTCLAGVGLGFLGLEYCRRRRRVREVRTVQVGAAEAATAVAPEPPVPTDPTDPTDAPTGPPGPGT